MDMKELKALRQKSANRYKLEWDYLNSSKFVEQVSSDMLKKLIDDISYQIKIYYWKALEETIIEKCLPSSTTFQHTLEDGTKIEVKTSYIELKDFQNNKLQVWVGVDWTTKKVSYEINLEPLMKRFKEKVEHYGFGFKVSNNGFEFHFPVENEMKNIQSCVKEARVSSYV